MQANLLHAPWQFQFSYHGKFNSWTMANSFLYHGNIISWAMAILLKNNFSYHLLFLKHGNITLWIMENLIYVPWHV